MRPKQFLKVLRDDEGKPESMVQRTVRLVKAQSAEASITVATSEDQVVAIKEQLFRGKSTINSAADSN
jgi:mannose-1-phosphate guanylyltransferase